MENVQEGIDFKWTNLWVLIFAILIASLGLNLNSTAVIIGAMLISPLMWPIMGIGVGMAINDSNLLHKSLKSILFAVVVGLVTSTLYFLLTPLSDAHSEILARTSPTIYDVLIAFFGGLAGIIAVSSTKKWNVIPGVAIATALMPPLCTAGYGIALGRWEIFLGAFYLFFINAVFIAIAALSVAKLLKFPYKEFPDPVDRTRSQRNIAITILVALIPSIYFGYDVVAQTRFATQANQFIEIEAVFPEDYLLKKSINAKEETIELIYGGRLITPEEITAVESRLPIYGLNTAKLTIKQGFASLYETDTPVELGESIDQAQIDALTLSLQEKEKKIQLAEQAKAEADIENQEVYTEITTLSPKVVNLSIAHVTRYNSAGAYEVPLVLIGVITEFSDEEKSMISNWLKKRLQDESVETLVTVLE